MMERKRKEGSAARFVQRIDAAIKLSEGAKYFEESKLEIETIYVAP